MQNQKVIGIIGGGQLGRMLTLAALPLGFKVIVLDPGDNCPAAQAGAEQIKGSLTDAVAIQQLAEQSDYVTIEIEHVNTVPLTELQNQGHNINPFPKTIELIQDKYAQKEFLAQHNINVAPFIAVADKQGALDAFHNFNKAIVLKSRRNAYDGRGNALVKNTDELNEAFVKFGETELYAEAVIPFIKEVAVMVAKSTDGSVAAYPVTETIHKRNICIESRTPAAIDDTLAKKATQLALDAIALLDGAGIYGVEMFVTKNNEVLINEIAPRVHNSGHYTMDACATSQFEQHIRAITGLPLGKTDLIYPAAVMVNILGERDGPTELTGLNEALKQPLTHIHTYGKSPTKPDRKLGHINSMGENVTIAQQRAQKAREAIGI